VILIIVLMFIQAYYNTHLSRCAKNNFNILGYKRNVSRAVNKRLSVVKKRCGRFSVLTGFG